MLKRIERNEALDAIYQGRPVYLMMAASSYTKLYDLFSASGYLIEVGDDEDNDEEEPEEDEEPDEEAEEIAEDPEEEDEVEDEPNENEDEPAPAEDTKPSAVHQKIVNMYLAGRTIKYIAQELGKSAGTVHYHLRKEGLV